MARHKNYHTIRYGTAEGEIKFGHIHIDNVRSSVMLRSGHTFDHYITLDGPGGEEFRTHSTTCRSPGSFQVSAGEGVPDNQPGIFMDAINGDIVIRASNGRIRLEAIDIDLRASGSQGERGNIVIDANDKCVINAQVIDCKAKIAAKFFSEKTVELVATNVMNVYGGFIDVADGATSILGSKPGLGTENEIKHAIDGFNFL